MAARKNLYGTGIVCKTHYCGLSYKNYNYVDVLVHPAKMTDRPQRMHKSKKTSLPQTMVNLKNSKRTLERKIQCNFTNGDYWVTLTYNKNYLPQNIDDAEKELKDYIKRLRYSYNAVGKILKYIYVTEGRDGRIHHHLLISNGIPQKTIKEKWCRYIQKGKRRIPLGSVHIDRITEYKIEAGSYKTINEIAGYIVKEFAPNDKKYYHRWKCSKNLREPLVSQSIEKVSKKQFKNMLDCPTDSEYTRDLLSRLYPNYEISDNVEKCIGVYNSSIYCKMRKRKIDPSNTEEWIKQNKDVVLKQNIIGQKMEVGIANKVFRIVDVTTGEITEIPVFFAVLPYSQLVYAVGMQSVNTTQLLTAHNQAIESFEGVPHVVVCHDVNNAVIKDWSDSLQNTEYLKWAEHNRTIIMPSKQQNHQKKSLFNTVVDNVLNLMEDKCYTSLLEFNEKLKLKITEFNHKRIVRTNFSRKDLWEDEKWLLKPLQPEYKVVLVRKKAKVSLDYHVTFEKSYYSVDSKYVGQVVRIAATATKVYITTDDNCCFTWDRASRSNTWMTNPDHLPISPGKWSAQYFISLAKNVGPNLTKVIRHTLTSREFEVQTYRRCIGLLSLSKTYPVKVIEDACAVAIHVNRIYYKYLKNICETLGKEPEVEFETSKDSHKYNNFHVKL